MALGFSESISRHIHLLLLFACTGGPDTDTGTGDTDTDTDHDDDPGVDCPLAGRGLSEPPASSATTAFLTTSRGWVSATYAIEAADVPVTCTDGSTWTSEDEADHVNPSWDPGFDCQGAVSLCGFGLGACILALEVIHD